MPFGAMEKAKSLNIPLTPVLYARVIMGLRLFPFIPADIIISSTGAMQAVRLHLFSLSLSPLPKAAIHFNLKV